MRAFDLRLARVLQIAAVLIPSAAPAQSTADSLLQYGIVSIRSAEVGVDPSDAGRRVGGRLLFDQARYHAGDDIAWADPKLNDWGWEVASTGLRSDILPRQGWPGIGWFRIRLRVDADLKNRELGFAVEHAGAIEVYLDGKLVYRCGTVGTTAAEEDPFVDQNPFVLPLEAGREHVLALRYSSFTTRGFRSSWYYTGPGVYWGDLARMRQHRQFARLNQGFFSAFFLAFALLFGLLYALYRSERRFLYLAVSYGLVVPVAFIGGQVRFVHEPDMVMPLVDLFFAFATGALLAMMLVLYAFFYPKRPKPFYGFLWLGAVVSGGIVFRLDNVVFFILFAFIIYVEILRVVIVALWRRKRWAWIIGFGITPTIVTELWSLLGTLGVWSPPWVESALSPSMVGIVVFASASAVYVGIRFAETRRSLAELEAARRLQLAMLPEKVPEHPDFEVAASMQTASEVGGDYYDFDLAEDSTLTVAVGDATGHGTKAGIMVTATKSLWNAFYDDPDLEGVLARSSDALKRMNMPNLYMAMALARLKGHKLDLVGAGLPPALIYRANAGKVETVPLKGMPLGGPGHARYNRQTVTVEAGDTVVLMTDGFPERFSDSGEMLGYERAANLFAEVMRESKERPPEEIIDQLIHRCERWANGRELDDDVTFVVLKMRSGGDSGA